MASEHQNNTRKLVNMKYKDNNNTHLVFEYNDNSSEEYEIKGVLSNHDNRHIEIRASHREEYDSTLTNTVQLVERWDESNERHRREVDGFQRGNFERIIFMKKIDFSRIIFKAETKFYKSIFVENIQFTAAIFQEAAMFLGAQFLQNVDFRNVEFNKKADFTATHFKDSVNFSNCRFYDEVSFLNTAFWGENTNFNTTFFYKHAQFGLSQFQKAIFYKAIFYSIADFRDTKFQKEAQFSGVIFIHGTHFLNAVFRGDAQFGLSVFYQDVDFINTKFYGVTRFLKSTFYNNASFDISLFHNNPNFSESYFEKKVSFANIIINEKVTELNFEASNIGFFIFALNQDVQSIPVLLLRDANITRMSYNTMLNAQEFGKIKIQDWQSWLALKNASINNNDNISALNFHTKEKNLYYKDLGWENDFINKTILFFEKHTSSYGTNWAQALIWLLCIVLVYTILDYFVLLETSKTNIFWGQDIFSIPLNMDTSFIREFFLNFNIFDLFRSPVTYSTVHFIAELFKNIIVSILLYEIIKSFRKFSRRL